MECIIVVDTLIRSYTLHEVYIQTLIICCHYIGEHIVFDKRSLLTGL